MKMVESDSKLTSAFAIAASLRALLQSYYTPGNHTDLETEVSRDMKFGKYSKPGHNVIPYQCNATTVHSATDLEQLDAEISIAKISLQRMHMLSEARERAT